MPRFIGTGAASQYICMRKDDPSEETTKMSETCPMACQEQMEEMVRQSLLAMSEEMAEQFASNLAPALEATFVKKEDMDALEPQISELQMDNNDVMKGLSDMASCMSDIAESLTGDREMTDAPVETEAPTEFWQTLGTLMEEGQNNKCSTQSKDRAFRLTFTSLENCLQRCSDDSRCRYASTNFMSDSANKYCIGCINLTQKADDWHAYEMMNNRRQLSGVKQPSEVERLRAENARLRAELDAVRR